MEKESCSNPYNKDWKNMLYYLCRPVLIPMGVLLIGLVIYFAAFYEKSAPP